MTTKLTYWERSPQESTQSARNCTLYATLEYKIPKDIIAAETLPGMVPSSKWATLWKGSPQQPPTS